MPVWFKGGVLIGASGGRGVRKREKERRGRREEGGGGAREACGAKGEEEGGGEGEGRGKKGSRAQFLSILRFALSSRLLKPPLRLCREAF